MTIEIQDLDHISEAAREFINHIGERRIFAFYGKMGAGKTTFVKAVCEALGVEDVITSPTFAIVNEYTSPNPSEGGEQGSSPSGRLGGVLEFKVTGRTILDPGWRAVYATSPNLSEREEQDTPPSEGKGEVEERTLPVFQKGESGPHQPTLTEKMTTPPPYYTEATLLRAMETAGKLVEDEELRRAMKENGIGRPSTRAAIIETLFKRRYIRKERKRLVATPTGMELIDLIREDLLKSCELTGIWEKKLRDIEAQKYDAQQFINELKAQVTTIVHDVVSDPTNRRVTVGSER